MNRIQLSDQSFNPHNNLHVNNSQLSGNLNQISNGMRKSRTKEKEKQYLKQNQIKHLNAIRPYVNSCVKQKDRERKISQRQSQKCISGSYSHHNQTLNQQSSNINILNINSISSGKIKNKKNSQLSLKKNSEQSSALIPKISKEKYKNIEDLLTQLKTLKCEYKSLKNSYNSLLKQNNDLTERAEKLQKQICPSPYPPSSNIQKCESENKMRQYQNEIERFKNKILFLENQNDRIKKESLRMIENEKFKNKKLQQTLQQKELMIAYLRSQLSLLHGETNIYPNHHHVNGFFFQNTAPTFLKPTYPTSSINQLNSNSQQNVVYEHKPIQASSSIRIIDHTSNQMSLIGQNISNKFNRNHRQAMPNHINHLPSDEIDLPRQISIAKKNGNNFKINPPSNLNINQSNISNSVENNNYKMNCQLNKRQYIFSNEDDSLSFSYEKSKSKESLSMSIDQIYEEAGEQFSSKNKFEEKNISQHQQQHKRFNIQDNPSVLTFTKKDLFIIEDQDDMNLQKLRHKQEQQKASKMKEKVKVTKNQQKNHQIKKGYHKTNKTQKEFEATQHKNSIVYSQKSNFYINQSLHQNISILKKEKGQARAPQNHVGNKRKFNNKRAKWNSKRNQKMQYQNNFPIPLDFQNDSTHFNPRLNEAQSNQSSSHSESLMEDQEFSQSEQAELDQQRQNDSDLEGLSHHYTHTNTNEQKSSYTGQQQLLTFQNRRQCIPLTQHKNAGPLFNSIPHIKQRKDKMNLKQKISPIFNTVSTKQKKQIPSKSKLLTKRLQVNSRDIQGNNYEGKDSSAETRKKPVQKEKQQNNSSKTGKKKLSRKRKSQQFGHRK